MTLRSDDRPPFPFPARYNGTCAADCGNRVHEGDMVQFVEGQLVHVGCIPDEQPEPKPRPVCPTCWLEQSVNGSCGCPT